MGRRPARAEDEEEGTTRREVVIAAIAGVIVAAIAGVLIVTFASRETPPPPPGKPRTSVASGLPKAKLEPIVFSAEGEAAKIAEAVEQVTRPGNARVAILERGGKRWVCLLVAGPQRYYELDQGLTLDDFPGLRSEGFQPPPSQIARTSTSIYRSYAKTAMGYDTARGDRVIILLCPKDEWPKLALAWPRLPEPD